MNKICQCCGMPMAKDEDFGTNKDESLNQDYCVYCFQKGSFTKNCTMEQQIEENLIHLAEFNKQANTSFNENEARQEMLKFFPTLKRWKKTTERYQSKVVVFLVLTRNLNGKTEVLLQKRCNTGYMDGMYDMGCSGHLEKGESLSKALAREAKEELGIDIQEKDLTLVSVVHPYQESYLNFFFKVENYIGTPTIMEKEKCEELNWFSLDNLPENTMGRIKNVLKNIENNIFYDDGDFSFQKYNHVN